MIDFLQNKLLFFIHLSNIGQDVSNIINIFVIMSMYTKHFTISITIIIFDFDANSRICIVYNFVKSTILVMNRLFDSNFKQTHISTTFLIQMYRGQNQKHNITDILNLRLTTSSIFIFEYKTVQFQIND